MSAAEGPALHSTTLRSIALVGNPNCGKTALFNLLTGARQKVANYAGVTVERRTGMAHLPNGHTLSVIDLPGAYSLHPATPDEQVMLEVIEGRRAGEDVPDALVVVVDATNLRMNLRLVLELRRLGRPMLVALNMMDAAQKRGLHIDVEALSRELDCPVIPTVAVQPHGHAALLDVLMHWALPESRHDVTLPTEPMATPEELQVDVRRILTLASCNECGLQRSQMLLDGWALHPLWGMLILLGILFLMFQAVFAWAAWPMDAIRSGMSWAGDALQTSMSPGPLRSLLVDGVIAGVGSVLVFLPQILVLFLFILVLEESGYLPRAAFLLDRAMGKVGLSGRAFIPLLSSFACAVPGIMAARTIPHWRDRITTIMIAPLMTCSARLPVYTLLIGTFVPDRALGPFNLRGMVLFILYAVGVAAAMGVAWLFHRFRRDRRYHPLMLELPPYRLPTLRTLGLGLWERTRIFLVQVGTIIFVLVVILWFLSSYPTPPEGATEPAIEYSLVGQVGMAMAPIFEPIGFNWQISVAMLPGMVAREVIVGVLGIVYALSVPNADISEYLGPIIAQSWSLPTAWSLLAWFVFAPQCISTLAVVRRETDSWRYPLLMAAYQFALAYGAAFLTYRCSLWWIS
ncbi:ferrous iron transporter B [Candidatus Symbiobacter mobilis]|uniref:Ferrous iron transport protein B n=1 Tax=Candidatus Symbiobacter mobilis CR TaxID=946483 RepID=U5N7E0_9BURK|nr:ferrous iron transporter B [Candidatus Symbiobacter mobilis]AGX87307.1 ferrous iron transport protein B [Candidatus Symbiobacter mobilis CR]